MSESFNNFRHDWLRQLGHGLTGIGDPLIQNTVKMAMITGGLFCLWASVWQQWFLATATLLLTLALPIGVVLIEALSAKTSRFAVFLLLLTALWLISLIGHPELHLPLAGLLLLFYPPQAFPDYAAKRYSALVLLLTLLLAPMIATHVPQATPISPEARETFNLGLDVMLALGLAWGLQMIWRHYQECHSRLASLNIRQKNLLRVACHDMSNPLSLIMGTSQIAQTDDFVATPEKLAIFWPKIEQAAEKLDSFISNLRAYEALQEPQRLVIRDVNLVPLLDEVCLSMEEKFTAKNIKLEIDHALPRNYKVRIDPHYFVVNVVKRLLWNAWRFAEENTTVSLSTTLEADNVQITIKDKGPGIDPELQERMFTYAFRQTNPQDAGEKGAGFCLTIAKMIIEEFNGTMTIDSRQGKHHGTTVQIRLPLSSRQTHHGGDGFKGLGERQAPQLPDAELGG
jgi:signal transduction histidine kinase